MVVKAKIDSRISSLSLCELRIRLKEKYMHLKKTNGWTYEKMALKVKSIKRNPRTLVKTQEIKRIITLTKEENDSKEDVIIVKNMATKRQIVGNFMGNPTQSQNKKRELQGQK